MLTALTVTDKTEKSFFKKIVNFFKGNKIKVEINSARGVTLRHVEYINRTGKINWQKLDSVIGAQRNHLLCSADISFPKSMGFRRFYSEEFSQRLCSNMGLFILSKLQHPERIKVALYDPEGDCADLAEFLLQYSENVLIVTDNTELYRQEAMRIIEDTGASLIISCQRESMSDCDFIIAPEKIHEALNLKNSAVLLTAGKPEYPVDCKAYFYYHFKMPNKFDRIKPQELSDIYFASALYTKARQHEFGSIVPFVCSNEYGSQRLESICAYFEGCA